MCSERIWDLTEVYLEQELAIDVLHHPSQSQREICIITIPYPVRDRTRYRCAQCSDSATACTPSKYSKNYHYRRP